MRFSQWHAATCRSGRLGFYLWDFDYFGFHVVLSVAGLMMARTRLWFPSPSYSSALLLWFLSLY